MIGTECPHTVIADNNFVFVMMPFADSTISPLVYPSIQQAVGEIDGKDFICKRADDKYTHISIWCKNICKNIRKAKYLIVDTTGKNPNVFYELGFSHALDNTKAIIIRQNKEDAPFDIVGIGQILYSEEDLPELRKNLNEAILALEDDETEEGYEQKSAEEIIIDLKRDLRAEEKRSSKYKKYYLESEKREEKFKIQIRKIGSIQNDPVEETKNKITELKGQIAEVKSKLKFTDEDNTEMIEQLNKTLKKKEDSLRILEEHFESYTDSKDIKPLSDSLLDEVRMQSEADSWFNRAYNESKKGNKEKAIKYYTIVIKLDPEYATVYNNRGNIYNDLKEYEKAMSDFNKAIELYPEYAVAYNNRGYVHNNLKEYEEAMSDFNKAIELDLEYTDTYLNISELNILTGDYNGALKTIKKALVFSHEPKDMAICIYLKYISRKLLSMDISDCEKEFNEILKQDFETAFSFDAIELWVETADISDEQKAFIIEKTEMLKKHKI